MLCMLLVRCNSFSRDQITDNLKQIKYYSLFLENNKKEGIVIFNNINNFILLKDLSLIENLSYFFKTFITDFCFFYFI